MATTIECTVTLDVRADLRAARDPLPRILEAVGQLKGGERLRLLTPFEPVPLLRLLARRGFSHQAQARASGDWEVLFSRSPGTAAGPGMTPAASPSPPGSAPVTEVDARGLEPPQPLILILESLASLPEGATLRARTDRRPVHLHAHLQDRGFVGETEEQHDGSFVTTIHRS